MLDQIPGWVPSTDSDFWESHIALKSHFVFNYNITIYSVHSGPILIPIISGSRMQITNTLGQYSVAVNVKILSQKLQQCKPWHQAAFKSRNDSLYMKCMTNKFNKKFIICCFLNRQLLACVAHKFPWWRLFEIITQCTSASLCSHLQWKQKHTAYYLIQSESSFRKFFLPMCRHLLHFPANKNTPMPII